MSPCCCSRPQARNTCTSTAWRSTSRDLADGGDGLARLHEAEFARRPEFGPFLAASFSPRRAARVIVAAACRLCASLGGLVVVWLVRRRRLRAFVDSVKSI